MSGDDSGVSRSGWLRAAVLGANDGILSTASLILGVATASQSKGAIMVAGVSGLVAGALSMASGEYVSVSSQADVEASALKKECRELRADGEGELIKLAKIYEDRGLDKPLARTVAEKLTANDALQAHARDELGLSEELRARPLQAAVASAASFSAGAALPLITAVLVPLAWSVGAVYAASLVFLLLLGVIGARAGGASVVAGAIRVGFWGALAMAATAGIGVLFHVHLS